MKIFYKLFEKSDDKIGNSKEEMHKMCIRDRSNALSGYCVHCSLCGGNAAEI